MYPTVVSQKYQHNTPLTIIHHSPYPLGHLATPATHNTLHSYATVLDQSLITNDKLMLQQILSNTQHQIIYNTLLQLNKAKINDLLLKCQQILIHSTDSTLAITQWLKVLLKLHLSTVLNNSHNKSCIMRIRKFIQVKTENYQSITKIISKLPNVTPPTNNNQNLIPKFTYVEQETVKKDQQQNKKEQDFGDQQQYEDYQDIEDQF